MSTNIPTPEASDPSASPAAAASKPRVLACVLCQQRKVKCDRKFPCANCVKSQSQCVPAATLAPRQRRRRFPERELLNRLRHYEALLRENKIDFEPLHSDPATRETGDQSRDVKTPSSTTDLPLSAHPSDTFRVVTARKAKNWWRIVNQRSEDSDEDSGDSSNDHVREADLRKVYDDFSRTNEHFMFGARKAAIDLSTLHPEQAQIFKLWQIYLDNVNPLLKVTHTPTLQGRIIDAAGDLGSIEPTLEALMFGIYCMAVISLEDDQCQDIFHSQKEHLLTQFQFGCEQALLGCGFLYSDNRDSLTALYLYLISVKPPSMDPRSISSMLGLAIRIAQRMGIHSEASYTKTPVFEAEMRRRLWWALVVYDARISELAEFKSVVLIQNYDCKTPLNVNDFDLRPEMKDAPKIQGGCSEALFAVIRADMGDFIRRSMFHIKFTANVDTGAKDAHRRTNLNGGELDALEQMLNDKYLQYCISENPLHFMTIWTVRGHLARNRLIEAYSRYPTSSVQQSLAQRDTALSCALEMLECDTKVMTSPLTTGYIWYMRLYIPIVAYQHVTSELRKRPVGDQVERAWEAMSANYEAHHRNLGEVDNPFMEMFAKMVLVAWGEREKVVDSSAESLVIPRIVSSLRQKVAQRAQPTSSGSNDVQNPGDVSGMSIDHFTMPMPLDFGSYSMEGQSYDGSFVGYGQAALNFDVDQSVWDSMSWNPMPGSAQ